MVDFAEGSSTVAVALCSSIKIHNYLHYKIVEVRESKILEWMVQDHCPCLAFLLKDPSLNGSNGIMYIMPYGINYKNYTITSWGVSVEEQ